VRLRKGSKTKWNSLGAPDISLSAMARPAVRLLRFAAGLAFSVGAAAAEEPAPAPPKPVAESTASHERAVSEHVAQLLAASTPRF